MQALKKGTKPGGGEGEGRFLFKRLLKNCTNRLLAGSRMGLQPFYVKLHNLKFKCLKP